MAPSSAGPPDFFAFHPRGVRNGFALGAMACTILAAHALANAHRAMEPFAEARAGVCVGLTLAFLYAFYRLRQRSGWGITLQLRTLSISRPISSGSIHIPWNEVSIARREKKALVLFLKSNSRVLIARHLFHSQSDFDAMVLAVTRRVVPPLVDA